MTGEKEFRDRADAGVRLAAAIGELAGIDCVVLGVPRGGVPVAYEVARALNAPLDVVIVRKLGLPGQPEVAMGAIGEDGARVFDDSFVSRGWVSAEEAGGVEGRERVELTARVERFRRGRGPVALAGRPVIVVDDGVATGATLRVACQVTRALGAGRVVAAVPVRPAALTAADVEADALVSVLSPPDLWAVGAYYRDFRQTPDEEVSRLLELAAG